jgi:catechol 2,3-dioxygenase
VIPPDTSIGKVRLRVADIDGLAEFYERVIGLRSVARDGDVVRLGPDDGKPLIELVAAPGASPAPSFSTGLFHLAILVPDRAELARSLKRVAGAGWRLTGASDHLVSEALYLQDPEGNGIEIYRDRPRDQWGHDGSELRMATLPLDLDGVLGELEPGEERTSPRPRGSTTGHSSSR